MTFDTEKFIMEIEIRNAIWDMSSAEYSDRDLKKRKWEEITNIMCDAKNLTENEKKELGKSLQLKWKNIRTSFTRELKRRAGVKSGSAASRKSPYVYFEQLQFLKETVVNNATQASINETSVAESNKEGGSVSVSDVSGVIRSPVNKRNKKTNDDALLEILKQSIEMREERERNNERNQESDVDRLFLLSLLDDFKKIPEHRRLSTKMELIEVIQRALMIPQDRYSDYELQDRRFSTRPNFGLEASGSGQYRHEYSTQPNYGRGASGSGHYRRGYSTPAPAPERQNSTRYQEDVLSQDPTQFTESELSPETALSPTFTTVSQESDLLELF